MGDLYQEHMKATYKGFLSLFTWYFIFVLKLCSSQHWISTLLLNLSLWCKCYLADCHSLWATMFSQHILTPSLSWKILSQKIIAKWTYTKQIASKRIFTFIFPNKNNSQTYLVTWGGRLYIFPIYTVTIDQWEMNNNNNNNNKKKKEKMMNLTDIIMVDFKNLKNNFYLLLFTSIFSSAKFTCKTSKIGRGWLF